MKKLLILLALLVSGCAATGVSNDRLGAFERAAPRSIVLVPVSGDALDLAVPSYVLGSVAIPLAEKGFYVFPAHTAKAVLERGAASLDARALADRFGADAVLYVSLNQWNSEYEVFTTTVTVDFAYSLVARDGTLLWSGRKHAERSSEEQTEGSFVGGLISSAISAAIVNARPNFLMLAEAANHEAFFDSTTGLPDGPYRKRN